VDPVSKIIIPFFALILFGFAAARRGWEPPAALRYESDVARISTALVASTALAAITFSVFVWYLGLGIAT
jgi:hypothetical protein